MGARPSVSLRENIDTGGPLGRAMVVIVGAISELEKSLIVERVRAGMRRAKLEGRRIGRAPLDVDRAAIVQDRLTGLSLTKVAKKHRVSRATVCRLVNQSAIARETRNPQTPVAGRCDSQVAAERASHKQPVKLRDSFGNHLCGKCGTSCHYLLALSQTMS